MRRAARVCGNVLQSVAGCCCVLQTVADCCRLLQGVAMCCRICEIYKTAVYGGVTVNEGVERKVLANE